MSNEQGLALLVILFTGSVLILFRALLFRICVSKRQAHCIHEDCCTRSNYACCKCYDYEIKEEKEKTK